MSNDTTPLTPAEVVSYTKEELDALLEEDYDNIFAIADDDNTDAATLELIEHHFNDRDDDISWAIASHANTPEYILRGYTQDGAYIAGGLALNSNLPADVREELLERYPDDEDIKERLGVTD